MAPRVERPLPVRLSPRKRRRVASYDGHAAKNNECSASESAEARSRGSDGEWAPKVEEEEKGDDSDADASSGGGGSDSDDDSAAASDCDGEDSMEGVGADNAAALTLLGVQAPPPVAAETLQPPTMGHTPELFCNVCEREFSFKHALVRHLKRRHKSSERSFECAVCRLSFRDERALEAHAADHRVVEGVQHTCKGCGLAFATRHERRQHFRKAHFFSCPFRTCADRFAEQLAWTKHIRRYHKAVAGVTFDCAECGEAFGTRHELEWHQQEQAHDAFVCAQPGCGKRYSKREHLTRHVAAAHRSDGKDKPFQCELCHARFAYKHGMVRHMKRSHVNQDRPYQCGVCQLAFRKKSLLQAHSYVHTGVLPFACDVCGERFAKRFLLARHQRSHSGSAPASNQVFVCDVEGCDAVLFSAEEQLEHKALQHQEPTAVTSQLENQAEEQTASRSKGRGSALPRPSNAARPAKEEAQAASPSLPPQFVCQVCKHTFSRRQTLRSHLRTHFEAVDERKLFACPMAGCSRTYTRASNVMAHYNAVHDARKSQRFVCPHEGCEGRFGYKSILTNHMAKIHGAAADKARPTRARKSKSVLESVIGVAGERNDVIFTD